MKVKILKVYPYRKARVYGPGLPREFGYPIWTKLGSHQKDNHIVVIAHVCGDCFNSSTVAFWFHDTKVYIGKPTHVVVKEY